MASEIKILVRNAVEEGIKEVQIQKTENKVSKSDQYLSRKEASAFLKISLVTLDKAIKENLIESYRILGSIRLKKSDLEAALLNRKSLKFKTGSKNGK